MIYEDGVENTHGGYVYDYVAGIIMNLSMYMYILEPNAYSLLIFKRNRSNGLNVDLKSLKLYFQLVEPINIIFAYKIMLSNHLHC